MAQKSDGEAITEPERSHDLDPVMYLVDGRFGIPLPPVTFEIPEGGAVDRLRQAALQHVLSCRLRASTAQTGETRQAWHRATNGARDIQWWASWTGGKLWLPIDGVSLVLQVIHPTVLISPETSRLLTPTLKAAELAVQDWEEQFLPEDHPVRRRRRELAARNEKPGRISGPPWWYKADEHLPGRAERLVVDAVGRLCEVMTGAPVGVAVDFELTDRPGRNATVSGQLLDGRFDVRARLPESWLRLVHERGSDVILDDGTLIVRDGIRSNPDKVVSMRLVPDPVFGDEVPVLALAAGKWAADRRSLVWDKPVLSDLDLSAAL